MDYNSSGTRTNSLLDAMPTLNAYTDSNAINVGYAIQSGVIMQKCNSNKHWCRLGTNQVVNNSLQNKSISTVVAINTTQTGTDCHTTFTSWNNTSGNNTRTATCNKAANGLWYDNGEGGTKNYSSASSYCSSKGMRLPTLNETSARSTSGVPNYGSFTWTSTVNTTRGNWMHLWRNTTCYNGGCYNNAYIDCYIGYAKNIRCVK